MFHISGTDIVRCLAFRFQAFGRPVRNTKKFEEGIFSDLRNLKAGSDASLEEPKSPFLDFMYKHNCIRTQKKQKVFYWYSVSHDRLFIDALERDLKREKANQEATSAAVAEPALSFEYDSSQSLWEQLTKAQQDSGVASFDVTNTSSSGPATEYGPSSHLQEAMASQMGQHAQVVPPTMGSLPQDASSDMLYSQAQTTPQVSAAATPQQPAMQQYQTRAEPPQYGPYHGAPDTNVRHSFPTATYAQRHGSVPAYMEYSPAPSFVSSQSHFEDYNNPRGASYEPITPPQQATQYTPEPAYASSEGTVFNVMAGDMSQSFSAVQQLQSDTFVAPNNYPAKPVNNMYSRIGGSPQYSERQRKPSASALYGHGPTPTRENPHAARRPSDLRRAVSAGFGHLSDGPAYERAASGPPMSYGNLSFQSPTPEVSRHSSPMHSVESRQQSVPIAGSPFPGMMNDQFGGNMMGSDHVGPFRRARSATGTELYSPYSQKTHSCPIPNCGRLFKRLEHLKRHVRTHTQERPYVCPQCNKAFSRSDNLAQHRRTHDEHSDGSFPTPIEEEDFSNDEDTVTGLDDASAASTFSRHHQALDMMVPGSMGPPRLPASAMNAGY